MKIGAFTQYFELNKSTIRYYTDIKLLLPDYSSTYPDYNDKCIKDMKDILKFKSMGFNIEEIQEIKLLERFYINLTENNANHLIGILNTKLTNHNKSILDIQQQMKDIKTYKKSVECNSIINELGVPLAAVNFLECPLCHKSFDIEDASIHKTSIISARLYCSCGTNYKIVNGIIQANNNKKSLISSAKQTESLDYINKITNEHIAIIKKTGLHLRESMSHWQHEKGILFINSDIDILMMNTDDIFQESGIYLLCGYDYDGLLILKSKMERQQIKGHFVFIYYSEELPLKKDIPYLVDNIGNLYDCVMNVPLGYGLNHFKSYKEAAKEWICIQIYTESKLIKSSLYMDYITEQKYIDIFKSFGFQLQETIKIGVFDYIDGMIENTSISEPLKIKYHSYIKNTK